MSLALLNYPPTASHRTALEQAAPGWKLVAAGSLDEALRRAPEAEVILGNRHFLQVLPSARRLRWMQSNSVGMDFILSDPLALERDFLLTNARGVYDDEIADHALALLLTLARRITSFAQSMAAGEWDRAALPRLAELPALVFGFGGVGRAIVRRLLAFGCSVRVVSRTTDGPVTHPTPELGIERLTPQQGLEAIGESRIVVVALPLTAETRGMFDLAALSRLPGGAFLVNIARGPIIDETALREVLPHLGGVALDVYSTEPLPRNHWLRSASNAVLTPHVARSPDAPNFRWHELFVENLRRWVAEEPLLNVVDKQRGY